MQNKGFLLTGFSPRFPDSYIIQMVSLYILSFKLKLAFICQILT